MKYVEYGKGNRETIVLLHGGGLSWWSYREAAEILGTEYRVVLPILDGHAGSDRGFSTIEENAEEVIRFIDRHMGGRVLLMGGLSLGGQVLLEILSRKGDICRYAVVESACVTPSKLTGALIGPVFGSCYGLIRQKWFSRLQFSYLRIRKELFGEYFRDTCAIAKEDMVSFLRANAMYGLRDSIKDSGAGVFVFAGKKESGMMRKSARMIHEKIKGSMLTMLPGLYHGEFSINHAGEYARAVSEIAKGERRAG